MSEKVTSEVHSIIYADLTGEELRRRVAFLSIQSHNNETRKVGFLHSSYDLPEELCRLIFEYYTELREEIYIFGGTNGDDCYDSLVKYDPGSRKWSQVGCLDETSPSPTPRTQSKGDVINDALYFFGGRYVDGDYLNDVWRFDLLNASWRCIPNVGSIPSPRSSHVVVGDEDSSALYVHAGWGSTIFSCCSD